MKRFTKVCLLSALALFIIGIVFLYLFGIVGGFSQLEKIGNKSDLTFYIGNMRFGIPYRFLDLDILDEDLDLLDIDNDKWDFTILSDGRYLAEYETAKIAERADRIREIEIDAGGTNLFIKESDDEAVWLENRNASQKVKYDVDSESITILAGYKPRLFRTGTVSDVSGELYLYLPSTELNKIKLEIGGGKLDSMMLAASEIDIELGGGKMTLDGLSAEELKLSAGAGNVDLALLEAKEAELEVGAGNLTVSNMDVSKLVVGVGAGNADLEGRIIEKAEIDCGMGNMNLLLEGDENDYDYNLDCAVGKIEVGNNRFSGLASERYVSNGSDRLLKIDCAVGTVKVGFKN